MKLKVFAKSISIGIIIITVLACTLIFVIDVPVLDTRVELVGTVVGIYQPQTKYRTRPNRFLTQLDKGVIVQVRTTPDVVFRKGQKAIIFEYTTRVLRRKVYLFDRYIEDEKVKQQIEIQSRHGTYQQSRRQQA